MSHSTAIPDDAHVLTTAELAAVRACVTHCWLHRREIGVKPETVLLAAIGVHEEGLATAADAALHALREAETAQLNFDRLLKRPPPQHR